MKLKFHIDYRTNWGESVYITGSIPALGGGNPEGALKLELHDDSKWTAAIDIPADTEAFEYRYFVRHENGYIKNEWGPAHKFVPGDEIPYYRIHDRWQDMPWDKPYYSSAFTDCIRLRQKRQAETLPRRGDLTLRVSAPMVPKDCVLAVSGEGMALGNWHAESAVRMSDANFPEWSCTLEGRELSETTQYKFLILKASTGEVVAWEGGSNRELRHAPTDESALTLSGMRYISTLMPWKGAGTAIPVFALRSEADFGVGDFYDLKKMVDWAVMTGQTFIQILPINDTTMTGTWTDSYPYNANSTFALHPMYLRVSELGKLADAGRQAWFDAQAKELNELPTVDYERATHTKAQFCREIFAQEGSRTLKSPAFRTFLKKNADWLTPYAMFCALRDRFHTADMSKWGEYAEFSKEKMEQFVKDNPEEINFVYYLQYHLDKQMHHVKNYANSHSVAIKGDIPIGISRTSVDAWVNPRLFNLDCQAGAPPDDFSVLGQNWGLPTYNWEEMNKDGFQWWKDRFRKMSEYFDAYRIDHVLGFFRIWQIPMDALHGLLGVFNPALPYTPDELRYNYDFWIDVDKQTTPYIMDYFVGDFFGPYTSEAVDRFMYSVGDGRHKLKDEFNTQRKIADYFAGQPLDEKNQRLCDGLLGLVDQVLFIEDPYEKGKYHPRISAQFTYTYRSLTDYERWCFDRLYNDFYYRRHNDFWYGKAMWKLPPLIDATDMLCCAEDLGMIPACVPAVMQQLEILSLEIQRMPKDPTTPFGNTWNYPYYSVCTTSTHDMGGIRAWWEENRDKTQDYYNNVLHQHGAAPYFAEPWICEQIIDLHLQSPSMLCILPLQDWMSMDGKIRRENPADEQINVPANPRHYWRYRMHLSLEELLADKEFNEKVAEKVKYSGR